MPVIEKGLITSNRQVGRDMFEMKLVALSLAEECQPGQFIHVLVGSETDPLLRRPLSLYDVDQAKGKIQLLYRVVGKGTRLLTRLKIGDYLDVMGPLGRGFSLPNGLRQVLLVGGGVGIAPLVYLARVLKSQDYDVTVLYGAASSDQLVVIEKLAQIGATIQVATMDGSSGYKGLVTELMAEHINNGKVDYIYTCGPESMMAEVARFARKYNLPGEVSLEENMACGVGACLGCARKIDSRSEGYVKVCREGPVFNIKEVDFLAAKGGCSIE